MWTLNKIFQEIDDPDRQKIEAAITSDLSNCDRCTQIWKATGYVPLICSNCSAIRGPDWVRRIELTARFYDHPADPLRVEYHIKATSHRLS